MIEKLKYDYIMTMPGADDFIKKCAVLAAPDILSENKMSDKELETDIRLSSPYSINGWDTVTICSVSDLNRAIESQKTYPENIDYTLTDEGIDYHLQADFSPWKIIIGGDGANINLEILFSGGKFAKGMKTYTITSARAVIQVRLDYLPQPKKVADPGKYSLKISKEVSGGLENPISVINFTSDLSGIATNSMAQAVMSAWLNSQETLEAINILFATAQLNMGESEEFSWLMPTYSSYAYTDVDSDPDKSKFGVLCMLKDRMPPAEHQLPAVVFEQGNNSAFLISREVYAQYQLLPALPQAFENVSAKDFTLEDDGLSIKAQGLDMPSVRYGAIDYYPKLDYLKIILAETAIECRLEIHTEISPGIVAKSVVITYHGLRLGKNDKDEPIMEYYQKEEPKISNDTEVAAWVIVTEVIANIIVAVAGLAVGKAVETIVKRVLAAIITVMVCAITSTIIHVIIERVIAEGVTAAIPDITPMIKSATQYVEWPFCSRKNEMDFEVKKIELYGTLYFEGVIS